MQKRISLLLVIVMIVTSLLACGKEKLNTKNESYEGKTGGFYTKQAIENWNSYDEADCILVGAPCRILRQKTALHGIGEDSTQAGVDSLNGALGERFSGHRVLLFSKLGVEIAEVFRL